jgi:hypothetical protein
VTNGGQRCRRGHWWRNFPRAIFWHVQQGEERHGRSEARPVRDQDGRGTAEAFRSTWSTAASNPRCGTREWEKIDPCKDGTPKDLLQASEPRALWNSADSRFQSNRRVVDQPSAWRATRGAPNPMSMIFEAKTMPRSNVARSIGGFWPAS